MNAAYLRQIFHETGFVADYTRFLKEIKTIIREDNEKKIHYLAQMIVNQSGNFKVIHNLTQKIENLRRLPWTGGLLSKANALGKELMKYSEGDS